MEWQIDYHEDDGIVYACGTGSTTLEEHKKFTEEAIACAREHNTSKIFIDFMQMEPNLSVLEVDRLPEVLKKAGVSPDIKMAVLFDFSSEKKYNFEFFGNVATLSSLPIQPFADKDEAIEWLKSE